jgi:hypothetical protein
LSKHSSRAGGEPASRDTPPKPERTAGPPARERRASHRVRDDQQSGQGSLSALSKLKMLERKRAAIEPAREELRSTAD